jgi:hypothetical protein
VTLGAIERSRAGQTDGDVDDFIWGI